jgi:hypothetical protein
MKQKKKKLHEGLKNMGGEKMRGIDNDHRKFTNGNTMIKPLKWCN